MRGNNDNNIRIVIIIILVRLSAVFSLQTRTLDTSMESTLCKCMIHCLLLGTLNLVQPAFFTSS